MAQTPDILGDDDLDNNMDAAEDNLDDVSDNSSFCDCPAHVHDRETPLVIDKVIMFLQTHVYFLMLSFSSNWHEQAAFQRSAFRRSAFGCSTTGSDVVATIFISLFSFFFPRFFSSVATFSHRRSARIKKLI